MSFAEEIRRKCCCLQRQSSSEKAGVAKHAFFQFWEVKAMWYVIQTITGREQELVNVIQKVLAGEKRKYDRCFALYQECIQRRNGRLEHHVEPLFPSYIFVETDSPEEFFMELKQVPRLSHLLGVDGCFWNIYEDEQAFLNHLVEEGGNGAEEQYLIRPSLVRVDQEGRIQKAEGVLGFYMDKIVKQRLRKRSVIIEIPFCGRMRRIRLGIRLEEDG